MAGTGPTFWESTSTFSPSCLQRGWRIKGGHCAPSGAGHGGSGVWSFLFEPLFARAVYRGCRVHWSFHTLVWHLEGQHCEEKSLEWLIHCLHLTIQIPQLAQSP
jgi:hypothetical protein